MNFYICSTVRHLLFALLKALKEDEQDHQILFFADFQDTSLKEWDLSELPRNIMVHESSRQRFREQLTQNWRGKLFYFLAMRNFVAPASLHDCLFDTLNRENPEFGRAFRNSAERRLWLFNERNKMARVFRLVTQNFSVIEEGTANYNYRETPWWRWPARIILRRPYNRLSIGEDQRCREVLVSHPEKLPPFVRGKGKRIGFLDTPDSKAVMRKIFGAIMDFEKLSASVIVATSPLEEFSGIDKRDKLRLYQLIVDTVSGLGFRSLIKIHPRENRSDYAPLTDAAEFAPDKLPLEVFIVLSSAPVTILSFFTSAGIGLEPYFRLLELCEHSEDKGYNHDKLKEWLARPDDLKAVIKEKFSHRSN